MMGRRNTRGEGGKGVEFARRNISTREKRILTFPSSSHNVNPSNNLSLSVPGMSSDRLTTSSR